jgi:hypothetical protein
MADDLDGAVASLGKAGTERTRRSRLAQLEVEATRRWIEAARGQPLDRRRAGPARGRPGRVDRVNHSYAVALHDAVRLGGASEVVERLRTLAAKVDGPVMPLYAAHAQALAAADAGRLEEVAASFEALGAVLLAAEVATEAAVAHRAAGRKDAARAWAAQASALARRCEGARTPALRLLDQPPELTQREHEVAGRGRRAVEPGDRRAAHAVGQDGGQPPATRLRQAQRPQPACAGAAPPAAVVVAASPGVGR